MVQPTRFPETSELEEQARHAETSRQLQVASAIAAVAASIVSDKSLVEGAVRGFKGNANDKRLFAKEVRTMLKSFQSSAASVTTSASKTQPKLKSLAVMSLKQDAKLSHKTGPNKPSISAPKPGKRMACACDGL